MLVRRRMMSWRRVAKSLKVFAAHGLLFSFTLLLVLKLDRVVYYSWWTIFSPLWLFHSVVARGRFSLPAPSMPHDRHWAPCHAIVATPLLVAFELLLCIHLEISYVVTLKIVFLPLLAFEVAILIDNVRMCRALMPGDDENMSDEAIWETLPHFWVAISMVFFIAASVFTLLKICGDVAALGWWDLFINFGIAECFAFLVCTKWYNPTIHGKCHFDKADPSSSSLSSSFTIRYLDWDGGLVVSADEERQQSGLCSLQDIGGHVMKIPFIAFQVMLFMHLEGTPPGARSMSCAVVFSPLFLLQGAGVLFAAYRLGEKIVLLVYSGDVPERYSDIALKARDCFGFLHHGSRLLGWWSIDEASREEQARLYCDGNSSGYNTFSPDEVKKMPNADLVEEIWKLQQQQQNADVFGGNSSNNSNNNNTNNERGLMFPEVSPIYHLPPPPQPPWSLPPVLSLNPVRGDTAGDHQFLVPPSPSSSLYAGLFNRRVPSQQFAYNGPSNSDHHHHHLRIISDTLGVGPVVGQPGSAAPFSLQAELGRMTAQEITDAKVLAASKSHSEAERRRRERINHHLTKLRSLLPNTTKTDKASLLAEVIQHVKELKRQTSIIAETSPVPTETDELTVDDACDEDARFVIKASLCCEDRSDLLPDLVKTLKSLRLRTIKAEITTLGGRVKNVLFVTGEEDELRAGGSRGEEQRQHQHCISSIQEALKAVMEKYGAGGDENGNGNVKKQRTNNSINILEQNRSL